MTEPTGAAGVRLGEIIARLNAFYPPALAEPWDRVGLICGDPEDQVNEIVLALDCTEDVVDTAIEWGAQLIIIHHPLLLRGTSTVATTDPKGRLIHRLIKNGIALFAAHTNADSARPGVNDKLAEILGVTPGRPIAPRSLNPQDKWGVYVPVDYVTVVKDAVFAAGAGQIGNYSHCAYEIEGRGQFQPEEGANPSVGSVGKLYSSVETRVEFTAPRGRRAAIEAAMRAAHPYEEPAFDITAVESTDMTYGLGRVGELDEPMTLRNFTQRVADRLPVTAWGVRAAGDPERMIRTVAVGSGAGDSFLDDVRRLGVDCYVTSDLRHHPVDEALRKGGPAIIDTAHWASESPWLDQVNELLAPVFPSINITNLGIRTDPWTIHAKNHATEEEV
ncbi:MAG: Nif3-like dinuclear metal center hexameric protein [Corynebacterium sp.]|nr:Nif3-like dinuclear metal center hexameric protein [Corynebacterium sp.]